MPVATFRRSVASTTKREKFGAGRKASRASVDDLESVAPEVMRGW